MLKQLPILTACLLTLPGLAQRGDLPALVVREGFTHSNLWGFLGHSTDSLSLTGGASGNPSLQRLGEEVPNFGEDHRAHWVYFRVSNASPTVRNLVVELDFVGIDSTRFYVWENDRLVKAVPTLTARTPTLERDVAHRVPAFRFSTRPGQTSRVGWRLRKTPGSLVLPINLHEARHFEAYTTRDNLTHGLAAGCLLLAAFLGAAFCFLTRRALYGFYALYALGLAGFLLEEQGYLNEFLASRMALVTRTDAWVFFSMLCIVSHTWFALLFLNLPQKFWRWAAWGVSGVGGLLLGWQLFGFPPTDGLYRAALAVNAGYVLLAVGLLLAALRSQRPEAGLYLAAVGPFFGTVVWICLATTGLLAESWLMYEFLNYSPVWEVAVLCVGLALRFSAEQRQKLQALLEASRVRAEMAQRLDEAQEAERQRLAQDLHDDLGQTLATARHALERLPAAPASGELRQLLEKASRDLRQISHNLMPVEFERFGLAGVLADTVQKLSDRTDLEIRFARAGEVRRLDPRRELTVFRIASELLGNALRHAEARGVFVQLTYRPDGLSLTVEDDGTGILPKKNTAAPAGIGLRSVLSRAQYIGASLTTDTGPWGTLHLLEIPYDGSERPEKRRQAPVAARR